MSRHSCIFLVLAIVGTSNWAHAQEPHVIDKVAAVVGSNIILQSEIEMQYAQYLAQGNKANEEFKCYILQQQLTQKLLAQQAAIDSIEVSEGEVDDNINSRLRYMSSQAGGQERLEQFLNRSLLQYKEEMRPSVYEQLKANKMQQNIVSGIDVTPLEVKRYFESLQADSLPYFNTEVEVGELVVFPQLTREEKQQFRDRAEDLRRQVAEGTDFATVARLYSQDGGSAPHGGDLGFHTRDMMVKEYTAMAFRMKPGQLSPVFESEHGFHFLEVLERRGEEVRTRHILVQIKPTGASLERAKAHIDSIYENVVAKKVDFYGAATRYSDNKETKYNGGMLLNMESQQSRTTLIPADKLDASVFTAIDTLQPGEYSKPAQFTDRTGKIGYRFTYLKSRTPPHQASLKLDYAKIKEAALQDKINRKLSEWFEGRRKVTFININEEYHDCDDLKIWLKDNSGEAVAQL
jgi:peptidyl-prolyl cis-trans isomerase SurA